MVTPPAAVVRPSGTTGRAVAVSSDMRSFALDDMFVLPVIAMDQEGKELLQLAYCDSHKFKPAETYKGKSKKENIHNRKRPTRLIHGTILIRIRRIPIPLNRKNPQIQKEPAALESRAIRFRDTAHVIHAGDQSADKQQVDECDEFG